MGGSQGEKTDHLFAVSDDLVTVAGQLILVAREISRLADEMESLRRAEDRFLEVGTLT